MYSLLKDIEEERDFLIKEMAHIYDKEEIFRLSGRIYELTKMKIKIQEMMVETNGQY